MLISDLDPDVTSTHSVGGHFLAPLQPGVPTMGYWSWICLQEVMPWRKKLLNLWFGSFCHSYCFLIYLPCSCLFFTDTKHHLGVSTCFTLQELWFEPKRRLLAPLVQEIWAKPWHRLHQKRQKRPPPLWSLPTDFSQDVLNKRCPGDLFLFYIGRTVRVHEVSYSSLQFWHFFIVSNSKN